MIVALWALPAAAEPPGWGFCVGEAPSEATVERCVQTVEGLCKAAANHDLCMVESAQLWMQHDANETLNYALRTQSSEDVGMAELSETIARLQPDFSRCDPDDARCYLETVVAQALSNIQVRTSTQP